MTIRIKRGSTLRLRCTHTLGTAVDLTGYTVTSSAETVDGETSHALTVALANQTTAPGVFTLTALTAAWDLGDHVVDVRFQTPSSDVYYSETLRLEIIEAIT